MRHKDRRYQTPNSVASPLPLVIDGQIRGDNGYAVAAWRVRLQVDEKFHM